MAIEEIPVRAKISIGSLVIETPYILSFSVSRNRSNPSTMNASLKVKGNTVGSANGLITVQAGVKNDLKTLFTGDLRRISVSPCWDDPSYVTLSIDATDVLARLQDTKFTRRQHSENHTYALITSAEASFKSDRFNTVTEPTKFTQVEVDTNKGPSSPAFSGLNSPGNDSKNESDKQALPSALGIELSTGGTT